MPSKPDAENPSSVRGRLRIRLMWFEVRGLRYEA
jgi:hypothetical protein